MGFKTDLAVAEQAPQFLASAEGVLCKTGLQIEHRRKHFVGRRQANGLRCAGFEFGYRGPLGTRLCLQVVQRRHDRFGAIAIGDEGHETLDTCGRSCEPVSSILNIARETSLSFAEALGDPTTRVRDAVWRREPRVE